MGIPSGSETLNSHIPLLVMNRKETEAVSLSYLGP
jgi:hypothetical protein